MRQVANQFGENINQKLQIKVTQLNTRKKSRGILANNDLAKRELAKPS